VSQFISNPRCCVLEIHNFYFSKNTFFFFLPVLLKSTGIPLRIMDINPIEIQSKKQ